MDRYLGKKIDGRYEISELIGIGGMANVYKAYDVIENRVVAVKILRDEYMGNDDMRRRFKNESKAMAVLNHPNVMKVYDVGFSEKMQSIVMEYIDGITLKEYIEQQGVLSWKETVHFTLQILRALQHAHDKGIVHRDVKPQNVMLLSNGTIKIADFGIARFARSETRTLTDRAIGSVHYISPEQAAGGTTDSRTDIYAAGVILYEMLTGRVPFEADTPVSVALKQIQTKAIPPREVNPSIPEGLQEITMHAMEKDMEKRYQSAAQMMRDIEEFKRDPSISFEYQYLNAPSARDDSKYSDAIQSVRGTKEERGKTKEKRKKKKRAPIIPVLFGVTVAFVIVTVAFIGWMVYLNNPFIQVEDVEVPNLVGEKYDNVKVSPKYEKFEIQLAEDPTYNSEYAKGVIFDQTPKAGTSIKVNKIIKVKISKGQESMQLPDFAGQDSAQVTARLKEMGLEAADKAVFDEAIPVGTVVKTVPAAGSEVVSGEVVTLYVSMGKKETLVTVPSLEGIRAEDAALLLGQMKLKIGKITYDVEYENEEYAGLVVGQAVAANSQVPEGTTIDVTVAGEDSSEVRLQLTIALPASMEGEITMSARHDRDMVLNEKVDLAKTKTWHPSFDGKSGQISEIEIYLDNDLYQIYELDFTLKGHRLLHDYSGEF